MKNPFHPEDALVEFGFDDLVMEVLFPMVPLLGIASITGAVAYAVGNPDSKFAPAARNSAIWGILWQVLWVVVLLI